jgi:hypothetical protein
MVLLSPGAMSSGNMLTLDSYVNNTFVIKKAPDDSDTCNGGTTYSSPSLAPCKTAFFTIHDRDDLGEQVVDAFEHRY